MCHVSCVNVCYIIFHYFLCGVCANASTLTNLLWYNIVVNAVSIDSILVVFPMLSYMNMPCFLYCFCCGMRVHCLSNHGHLATTCCCCTKDCVYLIICLLIIQWVTWTCIFPLFLVVVIKGIVYQQKFSSWIIELYHFQSFAHVSIQVKFEHECPVLMYGHTIFSKKDACTNSIRPIFCMSQNSITLPGFIY